MKINLPFFLKPVFINNNKLIRIGSKYDGGYVVLKESVLNTNHLITYGINDNFDFEKDFKNKKKCSLDSYDYSIDKNFWINRFLKDLIKFFQLKIFKYDKLLSVFKFIDFYFFFKKKDNNFFLKKVGKGSNSILFKNTIDLKKKNIFLKIDVEGDEYHFLNEILKNEKYFSGMVIEFHHIYEKYLKLKNFINKLKYHKLIHIHANTHSEINKKNLPECMELSFANLKSLKVNFNKKNKKFPIEGLDSPNMKRHSQFTLV